MKQISLSLLLFLTAVFIKPVSGYARTPTNEKPFVILITSYNNSEICEANIKSALGQKYKNFRIIFVNDCSSDDTFKKVEAVVKKANLPISVTLIDNKTRRKALANIYHTIHELIADHEVVVSFDGDDLLPNKDVLNILNEVYSDPLKETWMTYGQFTQIYSGHRGWCCPIPQDVIDNNSFRSFSIVPSHLRTFYAALFKKIAKEDLMYGDDFYEMTWDMAMMLPMIEMARHNHFTFIPKILYLYNDGNQISDHRVDVQLQRDLDAHIRKLPPYEALDTLEGI